MSRIRLLMILALLAVLAVAVGVANGQHPPAAPAGPAAAREPDRSVPVPGARENDGNRLQQADAYWRARYTYPTGKYDPAWLLAAAAQDRQVPRGIPAGQVIYNPADHQSPLTLNPNGFISLGPMPLETTGCQVCYPFGRVSGRANALAINPTVHSIAYAGTAGGGVWKTTNCCTSSTTWTLTTDDSLINTTEITSLAVDPNNPSVVYAGTGDLQYNLYPALGGSQGILKSSNGGTTWSVVGADVFVPNIHPPYSGSGFQLKQAVGKVKVDPRNSNNVLAGTRHGYYVSNNGGTTWTGPCFTNSYASTQAQVVTGLLLNDNGASTDVYIALGVEDGSLNGADGVYKATLPAGGCPAVGTWTLLNNNWPPGTGGGTAGSTLPGRIDIALAPSNAQILYAQAESFQNPSPNGGGQLGVWRTTNGGTSWTQQSDATALHQCDNSSGDYNQNGYDQDLAVDPNNPNVLFMDTFEIWKSTDSGVSFTDLTCVYSGGTTVHPDQHQILFVPGSSLTLLAANDGGAYVSSNAGTGWSQLNNTLNTIEFYSGDITANFANAAQIGASGGAQDNGDMVYTGPAGGPALWHGPIGGDGFWTRIDQVNGSPTGGTWFLENNSAQWWRSTTGPTGTYSRPNAPEPWAGDTRAFAMPFEIQRNDCGATSCPHLIAGSYRVWETTDSGTNWLASSGDLTKGGGSDYINQLTYATSTSAMAIVGTSDGNVQYGFGLGTGSAGTWVDVTGSNNTLPNRPILDVTTDPVNPLIGYAAVGSFNPGTPSTPGHLFQVTCTANCGTFTWVDKTGNLPDIPLDAVIANPRYPRQVFAGSDWGLYFTNDITANPPAWQRFQAGLPNVMISDLVIDRGTTTLAAWTRNRGLYVWPLPAGPFIPPSPTPPGPPATATPCTGFSDVHPADYFYTPVAYLVAHGVISGYGDCTFRPYNNTTRGQMVKIVVLGFAKPIVTPPGGAYTFHDVPPAYPFFPFVETAAADSIVSGYGCGGPGEPCDSLNRPYFRPSANVTRGQLSKIDVAAAGWTLLNPATGTFHDVLPGSAFYLFVETAACHGVVSGYACGGPGAPCDAQNRPYFRQGNNAIRGQIAKIVYLSITGSACP